MTSRDLQVGSPWLQKSFHRNFILVLYWIEVKLKNNWIIMMLVQLMEWIKVVCTIEEL